MRADTTSTSSHNLLDGTENMERFAHIEEIVNSQSEYILELERAVSQLRSEVDVLKSAQTKAVSDLSRDIGFVAKEGAKIRRDVMRPKKARHTQAKYQALAADLIKELQQVPFISVEEYLKKNDISKDVMSRVMKAAVELSPDIQVYLNPMDRRKKIMRL